MSLEEHVRGLKLVESTFDDKLETPIPVQALQSWETELLSDAKNRLAQNAFARTDITEVVANSAAGIKIKDQYLFNTTVKTIGSPGHLNNQKKSGRCWIFATANVLRSHVLRDYKLKDDKFQFSQTYLFFYDKLEKANFFLENIIDTSDEELDSRLIQYLLKDPVGDGGQWDMIVNLVNKYGLVPYEIFPDNSQAISTSKLNYIVTEKLREYALILRKLYAEKVSKAEFVRTKESMNKEIYNIISLALGTPPKPTDPFVWEYLDKDDKFHYHKTSALDFKKFVSFDVNEHFSLIHDPRNPYYKLYTVDRLNNIHGGKLIEYVNTEIEDIKTVAIRMLKDNEPIFFGSDVGKFKDNKSGILDNTAYDFELGFGTGLKIDKAERLRTGSSLMTHAMVITGVHIDPITEKPVRWQIENSWGEDTGEKGYFMMSDEWFNEYVYQIVTHKKYVDKKVSDVYDGKDFTVLPYYDPMGALA